MPIAIVKPTLGLASQNGCKARSHLKPTGDVPCDSADVAEGSSLKPRMTVSAISAELQLLQRQRAIIIKSRIMVQNRLTAIIAGTLGYTTGLDEKKRRAKFTEASKLIKQVAAGEATHQFLGIILATMKGIEEFDVTQEPLELKMIERAAQLPVAEWIVMPEQRGIGVLFLAIVIGETGDLNKYANPGKVWRRLGCAPYTSNGKTAMGATWRGGKEGKLSADQWSDYGYSPRRRSIAYLIGTNIVRQNFIAGDHRVDTEVRDASDNGDDLDGEAVSETEKLDAGPYRRRYLETKALATTNHPDWTKGRCHSHGMLLATKLLLKNLWIEWTLQKKHP